MASEADPAGAGGVDPDEVATEAIGEAAVRAALAEHGEDIAAAIERTDQVKELIDLAILTVASADDDQVDHVTEAMGHLIKAVDGLSAEGSVALAEAVGDNGDELARALVTIGRLERTGKLDDLLDIAESVSAVHVTDGTADGLDRFAGAITSAEANAEPVGLLGFLRGLLTPEGRAGMGYLLTVVRALGAGGWKER